MKIATHDSATGERSKNLLHSLGKIFAMTQTKTIREQYDCGVRYFDLRVDRNLTLCHGLWKANKNLADILIEMKKYVSETTYIAVTIERGYPDEVNKALVKKIRNLANLHGRNIELVYIAKKKPSWEILKEYRQVNCVSGYLSVPTPRQYITRPFKDWRRYIPIPWVLKKITPKVEFNGDFFTMVDFV